MSTKMHRFTGKTALLRELQAMPVSRPDPLPDPVRASDSESGRPPTLDRRRGAAYLVGGSSGRASWASVDGGSSPVGRRRWTFGAAAMTNVGRTGPQVAASPQLVAMSRHDYFTCEQSECPDYSAGCRSACLSGGAGKDGERSDFRADQCKGCRSACFGCSGFAGIKQ